MEKTYGISFQLFSSRDTIGLEGQLDKLAMIGYDAVEPFSPNYSEDPALFRKTLDGAGLDCSGFHLPYAGITSDTQRYIDIAFTIGAPLLIVPFLLPEERPATAAGWREVGEALGRAGAHVEAAGLHLAWHNHAFEYERLDDGSRPMDHLMEAGGVQLGLEADIAWIVRAQTDPADELRRYQDRIRAIQVKDTRAQDDAREEGWAAMGDGIIDWESLWPEFAKTPTRYLVVEHDKPDDWHATARQSYDYLLKMGARGEQAAE